MGNKTVDRLDNIVSPKGKWSLTIPVVISILQSPACKSQADIARMAGVSAQAVSQFVRLHYAELHQMLDYDKRCSLVAKYQALRIINSIDELTIKKAGLQARIIAAGILIDKSRLLDGKSTTNVSFIGLIREADAPAPEQLVVEQAGRRGRGRPVGSPSINRSGSPLGRPPKKPLQLEDRHPPIPSF